MDSRGEGKTVGVVIPTANRPVLMIQALRSVLGGTIVPDRVFVVIDSTGENLTREVSILQEWIESHSWSNKVFTLEGMGRGPAHARNLGVAHLQTDYVAFLDSDDLWAPTKLERQLSYLKKRPHLTGCQTLELWEKNGFILNQPERLIPIAGQMVLESMEGCMISPSAVIIRRDIFQNLGGFDEHYPVCEDYELWLRFLKKYPMGLVAEKLVTKRSGEWDQLSRGHSLDLYRARALLKNVDLWDGDERTNAGKIFFAKLDMVSEGAKKRGLPDSGVDLREQGLLIWGPDLL